MRNHSLEVQALEQTRHLIKLASVHYGVSMPTPEVHFNLRGKAAGMVVYPPHGVAFIRYNQQMLLENGDTFIEQTVPHEVAHLVARRLHGSAIRPHGTEWRKVMKLFAADPVRCHSFTVSSANRRQMRYFLYQCVCQDHRLSAIRHHRSLAGVTYLCRRCGSPLRWSGSAAD
jgi:SprT protein